MLLQVSSTAGATPRSIISELISGILQVVPKLLTGFLFLVIAYVGIRVALGVVRRVLRQAYSDDQSPIVELTVVVVGIFLWFGALLSLLKILGMGDIAASLGTATGFVGLGVAFALKEMIADTVAGVYLIRDPDFDVGDRVDTASVTGTIENIGLRKTRILNADGDLVVVANRDVEKKWMLVSESIGE